MGERDYFREKFVCERISINERNKKLISDFTVNEHGKGLLRYLQNNAWADDMEGETAVYIVKDRITTQPVLFFSIKCGLLYDYGIYQGLSEDEKEYVHLLVEARQQKDNMAEEQLLDAIESVVGQTRKKVIVDVAIQKAEHELQGENKETEQKVRNTYSAVELCHFCRNSGYVYPVELHMKLGSGIFWEQVVPTIESIVKSIGCKYIYLFAADEELNTKREEYRLIKYYESLGFSEIMELKILKPAYDNGCYPMMQRVENLLKLREKIWNRFDENV